MFYYKQFEKLFEGFNYRRDLPRVFDDFLTMVQCSYHRTNIASRLHDKDAANEKRYLDTIKPYSKEELDVFAHALAILKMSADKDPYDDILGRFFTERITNGRGGQYFTPQGVAGLLSAISVDKDNPPVGKTIYDPACGSGRLLLEFARVAPKNTFFGNDVSIVCAKMTSLNMLFNGMVGEAAAMNTLQMRWSSGWHVNTSGFGIVPIEKERSRIWTAPPPQKPQDQQLTMF